MSILTDKRLSSITEVVFYILFALFTFVFFNAYTLYYPKIDTSVAQKIQNDTSERTFSDPPQFSAKNNTTNLFTVLMILVGILIVVLIILIVKSSLKATKKVKQPKSNIEKLHFSRDAAKQILQESLVTGNYSEAVVAAYLQLDNSLNAFREAYRPKFWTPKEYAYRVIDPVFQPSVYKIVEIYYAIRYGYKERTREHVLLFLEYLDKLLVNEVSPKEKTILLTELYQEVKNLRDFSIIPKGDLTKPRRIQP